MNIQTKGKNRGRTAFLPSSSWTWIVPSLLESAALKTSSACFLGTPKCSKSFNISSSDRTPSPDASYCSNNSCSRRLSVISAGGHRNSVELQPLFGPNQRLCSQSNFCNRSSHGVDNDKHHTRSNSTGTYRSHPNKLARIAKQNHSFPTKHPLMLYLNVSFKLHHARPPTTAPSCSQQESR